MLTEIAAAQAAFLKVYVFLKTWICVDRSGTGSKPIQFAVLPNDKPLLENTLPNCPIYAIDMRKRCLQTGALVQGQDKKLIIRRPIFFTSYRDMRWFLTAAPVPRDHKEEKKHKQFIAWGSRPDLCHTIERIDVRIYSFFYFISF